MKLVDIDMTVSYPCMVDAIPVCDPSYKWPRVLGERVEVYAVNAR